MPKTAIANGKTFTFDDNVSEEQMGIAIDEYFKGQTQEVKKKDNTTPVQKDGSQNGSVSASTLPSNLSEQVKGIMGIGKSFPTIPQNNIGLKTTKQEQKFISAKNPKTNQVFDDYRTIVNQGIRGQNKMDNTYNPLSQPIVEQQTKKEVQPIIEKQKAKQDTRQNILAVIPELAQAKNTDEAISTILKSDMKDQVDLWQQFDDNTLLNNDETTLNDFLVSKGLKNGDREMYVKEQAQSNPKYGYEYEYNKIGSLYKAVAQRATDYEQVLKQEFGDNFFEQAKKGNNDILNSPDFNQYIALKEKQQSLSSKANGLINDSRYTEVKKDLQKKEDAQIKADAQAQIKKWYNVDGELNYALNKLAYAGGHIVKMISEIPALATSIDKGYDWTDKLADWGDRFSNKLIDAVPTSSDLKTGFNNKVAKVGDYKVIIGDNGNPIDVRDKNNFKIPVSVSTQVLDSYNSSPDKYDIHNEYNPLSLADNGLNTVIDMGVMILGTKGAGLVGAGEKLQKLTSMGIAYQQTKRDVFNDAIKKGLDPRNADALSNIVGIAAGTSSALNPMEYNIASGKGLFNFLKTDGLNASKLALIKEGKLSVKDYAKEFVKEGIKNTIGENIEELGIENTTQALANNHFNSKISDTDMQDGGLDDNLHIFDKQGLETLLITAGASLLMTPIEIKSQTQTNQQEALKMAIENPDDFRKIRELQVKQGQLTQEQVDKETKIYDDVSKTYNAIKDDIKSELQPQLLALLTKKYNLSNKISEIKDEVLSAPYKAQLEEINKGIESISKGTNASETLVAKTEKPVINEKIDNAFEPATDVNLQVDEFGDGKTVIDQITEKPIIEEPKDLAVEKPAAEMDNAQLDEIFETKIANPDAELDNIFSALPLKNKVDESQITPNELVNTRQEQDVSKGLSGEYQNDKGLQQELGEGQDSGQEVPTEKVEEKVDDITIPTKDKAFSKEEFVRDIDKLEKEKTNGSKNIGLYSFKDKFVKLVKSKRKLSKENLNTLRDRVSDMDNVYPALEIIDLPNGSQAIVMDKATGKIGNELSESEINEIPQAHWDKFEKTIRELSKRGIQTDLTKRSNVLYDKNKGFQFIDLEGASIEGDATNKFFEKDGKEFYYDFEKYPFFPRLYKSAKEIFTNIGVQGETNAKGELKEQPKAETQKKVEQVSVTQKNKQPTVPKMETTENPIQIQAEEKLLAELVDDIEKGKKYDKDLVQYFSSDKSELFKKNGVPESLTKALGKKDADKKAQSDKEQKVINLARAHNNIGKQKSEDKVSRAKLKIEAQQEANKLGWGIKMRSNGNFDIVDEKGNVRKPKVDLTPEQKAFNKERKAEAKKWTDKINNFDFYDIKNRVLQYIATGGRIHTDDLINEIIGKGNNTEFRKKRGMHSKSSPRIDGMIEKLLGVMAEDADATNARNAIIEAFRMHTRASAEAEVISEIEKQEIAEGEQPMSEQDKADFEKFKEEQLQNEQDKINLQEKELSDTDQDVVEKIYNLEFSDKEAKDISDFLLKFKNLDGSIDWDGAIESLGSDFSLDLMSLSNGKIKEVTKIIEDAKGKREKQNESPTGEDIVVKDSVEETSIGNEQQQQGEQQAGTKQSTKRSADEIKTDIKTKSAELKALEEKQSKLNAQLEKNLQENQLDLLQGANPQSMFDDKVEQQKVAESLKEEISQRRRELDKLKNEFDNINQGELELTGKELIGDALDRIVDKIGGKKNLTEQEKTTLTKDITDLAKGLLQEGKATIDNIIDKIIDAIKERLPNLDEKDVKDLADTIKAKVATNRAIEILKDKGLTFEQAKAEFDKRNILYNEDELKDGWYGEKKEKPKTENKPKGEVVEKTVLNQRVFKGEVSDELRRELKKHDLNRTTIPYHEARRIAQDIIENVGLDTAFEAVERGDITGSPAAEIYNAKLEDLEKQINKETDADVLQDLIIEQARIFSELSDANTKGGQFSSQMRYIYETSDIGYNVEKKISEWKEQFGEISPEVEQKFRDLDAQIKELNKQIVEAEQKAVEAEQKAILESIKASSGRKAKSTKVYGKDRVARGVDNLASLMGVKLSATGLNRPSLVKALTDIGVGLIEEGIATTENVVEKVKEYVKSKFGDKINVDDFADDINNAINLNTTQGKVKVPHSLIEKIVSEMDFSKPATENFKLLVETVMEELGSKFPDATERDFRDAITNYGKIVNLNADEIAQQIRKLKRIGKIESALEDIRNKKRPLRSGQQRDKLDAEERAKLKELREAMKELPMDEETLERELKTQLDAEKTRVRNQIEDLQREIDKNELTPRNARTVREDAELKELKEKRDKLKEEHDAKFKDDDYKEKKRLELAKKTAEKKIEDLQRRIREGDFSKAVRKPLVVDTELVKLKAQKLEAQEQYDKEFYKNKLKNRTKGELVKDSLWELWGITRALRATGEFSFVGVQGLINTIAHPMQSAKAFKNALTFFGSEKKTEDWLRKLKSQPYYPDLKASKLAITEPHAELNAREELFYSGWTNIIWNSIGTPLMLNKKAYEVWKNSNPFKAVERASVGYLDTIRVARYLDGVEMLKEKGITFNDNPQAYKEMADVINTFTGRGSIKFEALGGKQESSELLSKIFFSPKNWSSMIKTATPYALYHFGKKRAGAEAWKPSVAQKMALADFSKFVGFTTTMLAMAAVHYNNDDDDETEVELDPRSSDFGKIRIGKKYIDPWGGRIQQVILISKLISQSAKTKDDEVLPKTKDDEVLPLGIPYKTPTHENLLIRMALNKLSPSAQILDEYLSTTMKMNKETGEYERNIALERGGGKYEFKDEMLKSLYPIYWGTVADLYKDDPSALNGLLGFYAFFGGGVNVYKDKEDKTPPKRSGLIQKH